MNEASKIYQGGKKSTYAVAIACALSLVYAFTDTAHLDDVARKMGNYMSMSLILFLFLRLIFTKGKGYRYNSIAYLLLLISMIAGYFLNILTLSVTAIE